MTNAEHQLKKIIEVKIREEEKAHKIFKEITRRSEKAKKRRDTLRSEIAHLQGIVEEINKENDALEITIEQLQNELVQALVPPTTVMSCHDCGKTDIDVKEVNSIPTGRKVTTFRCKDCGRCWVLE